MTSAAEELHRAAVELSVVGRYAAARRTLARAAAVATEDEADVRARILGTSAYVQHRTGDPAAAERTCRDALAMPGLTPHTVAILAGQMGVISLHGGRLEDAVTWLSRAIADLADDRPAAARNLLNRSVALMQLGRLREADADLEAAAATFASLGMTMDEAQARHNVGYVALLSGDLVRALESMLAARPDAAASPVATAIGDLDRAEVLRDAGLPREAERTLAHVAHVFGTYRMRQSRAEAEFQLARSLLSHDADRARTVAAAAARRFRALGNDAWAARAEGIRLRAALAGEVGSRGSPPPARRLTRASRAAVAASVEQLVRHGFQNEAASLRLTAALADARTGGLVPGVLRIPKRASMEVQLLTHEVRAARASRNGRPTQVRANIARGLDTLAEWQRSFGSLDLQTSVAMHGASLMFAGLRSALASGRPDVVFEWSERARQLSQQVAPLRPPPDPEMAAELAQLRMLRAENADRGGDWLSDPRAAALRERARERQWTAVRSGAAYDRISLTELQEGLEDGTAFVTYVFTGVEMAALVVTSDRTAVHRLRPWADIQRLLSGLRADLDVSASIRSGPVASVVRAALEERMSALSSALLADVLSSTDARRVALTIPGILSGVPWAMLPALRDRVLTVAVSATQWQHRRHGTGADRPTAGFAVGPRVARGAEETAVASHAWHAARTLSGATATVDALVAMGSEVDVLHIAAHGRHAADNPMFSGLELSDGTLFGYDIDLIDKVPDTIILSACEGGRSSVRWGEEAIGMTRIWLHAGTRSVVAAPVIVADDDACELLGAMHERLAAGASPSEALAAASERTGIVAPFQVHGAGF
ncbi:CHAT domain-containing protein [Microbacterium sp. HD4P20]|uniref:CHAT domain-containing protein n=1 Tax=Microbacterium sp. HD4P20 TaxID=2864874 RepID=UPI001C641A62|nr:CHAT domain-containing protein [Microbacterium sp. HD4P20]MCP2637972.1 CHAT domain-containing protein [Microbacterium sp. HD4P20]